MAPPLSIARNMATGPVGPNPPPPPSSSTLRAAGLVLRVLTFISLLISIIILTTNTATLEISLIEVKIRFKDVYAYRYMLATIVFGLTYTLLQTVLTLYHVATKNSLMTNDLKILFDFYGDKVISYFLATGAAAGFGATKDMKSSFSGSGSQVDKFFNKGYASSTLLLIAFFCTAFLSILSSYALRKRS